MAQRHTCNALVILAASLAFTGCTGTGLNLPPQWAPVSRHDLLLRTASRSQRATRPDPRRHRKTKQQAEQSGSRLALARELERHRRMREATRFYRKAIVENRRNPLPYHRLGVIAAQLRNFDEANTFFNTARKLAPPSAGLLADIGYTNYLQGRLKQAEVLYRKALAKDPRHGAAANNLGMLLGEQERYDEALDVFRSVSTEAEAHFNLAYVYQTSGKVKEAEEHYRRALELDAHLQPAAQAIRQLAIHQLAIHQQANRPSLSIAQKTTEPVGVGKDGPRRRVTKVRRHALSAGKSLGTLKLSARRSDAVSPVSLVTESDSRHSTDMETLPTPPQALGTLVGFVSANAEKRTDSSESTPHLLAPDKLATVETPPVAAEAAALALPKSDLAVALASALVSQDEARSQQASEDESAKPDPAEDAAFGLFGFGDEADEETDK